MDRGRKWMVVAAMGVAVSVLCFCLSAWPRMEAAWYEHALRSGDARRAEWGARGLVRSRAVGAIPLLIEELLPPDGTLAEVAPTIIESMGEPMQSALLDMLEDDLTVARLSRVRGLLTAFGEEAAREICERYRSATPRVRRSLLNLLCQIGYSDADVDWIVIDAMGDADEGVRTAGKEVLLAVDNEVLCPALERFGGLSAQRRIGVAYGIAALRTDWCAASVGAMVSGLDDPVLRVRESCSLALAILRADEDYVVRRLMLAYRDDEEVVRENALWALAVGKSMLPVTLFIDCMEADTDDSYDCERGLKERGSSVIPALLGAFERLNEYGRSRVRYIIRKIGSDACAELQRGSRERADAAGELARELAAELCGTSSTDGK